MHAYNVRCGVRETLWRERDLHHPLVNTVELMARVCCKKELQLQGASSYEGSAYGSDRISARFAINAESDDDDGTA